ncbi:TnsA-like heteromeric transposase endonuclease subunit [Mycobacteroides abscessus]|uniref:TnsA-like heteromeric transposase endonuclease subunit n=1 Tax=Mycobacteroides abscessus TaxID=36809 RepID=UPI00092C3706|nr:TnsA-like heteromeric transposase endonuclease subunit [Mycobacteroides abscessus]MDO3333868.1 TnsA-like heteromeric transposase endonuclease subunit [Mycobacteroides abscessus subsp. bolletii]QSM86911.1 TnsA-like heteromeric transposase endonuclease subunit [Mycobacteroides abscessus subsp. bolletii]SIB88222.1 TnsA endonuclease N terminal protein [Mycobacteroides abscessus subsp. bolletii]SIJ24973.1 TnsA endonuclease N terminal protein [Mycobacteroides abscessus subsp. bolletii]SKS89434.1 
MSNAGRVTANTRRSGQVEYRPAEGLPVAWATAAELGSVRFETCAPIRKSVSYKGQKNFTGQWWSATTGTHLPFDSWVKRDFLINADFDPAVVAISVWPFTFQFTSRSGKLRNHTPDIFLRLADGNAALVDVRTSTPGANSDEEAFAAAAALCDCAGWSYRRATEQPEVRAANLRWLAGYRHGRNRNPAVAATIERRLTDGALSLDALAASVGEPIAVLPTIYHLLWIHELVTDVDTTPLSGHAVIGTGQT